ncbi:MAG: hypothetical protein KKE17_03045 [Proteobacteria bacterium]|nr:hypothetical protein [Pseudomonadota bacterium]MBU1708959.1 hypothetical protein [Pseudomonadota bacterium]
MFSKKSVHVIIVMGITLGFLLNTTHAFASKPNIMPGCKTCHIAEQNVIRGKKVSHSEKFQTVQVDVGPLVWIVKYDKNTEIIGADSLDALTKDTEIAVTFQGTEKEPIAAKISAKQPFKLPEEQIVSVDEMLEITAPEKAGGNIIIIDSRPPDAFASGHIPGAVSIPFPKLKELGAEVLPPKKDMQIIFYCGGFT